MQAGEGRRVYGQRPKFPERSPTTGAWTSWQGAIRSALHQAGRQTRATTNKWHLEEPYHKLLHTRATNRV
jgi:hypothetical protein